MEQRKLATWMGVPLEDMTKEQLIAALRHAVGGAEKAQMDRAHEDEFWRSVRG